MNIKIEQKKEYIKPQISVLEYDHVGALLCVSGCEMNDDDIDAEFLPAQNND